MGRPCSARGRGCGAGRRRSRSLLSHDVDDPLVDARARAARRRAPTSPATSCAAATRGSRPARARALALRDRRSDPHNTFDFLMDIERAPRAAQRLLLPRPTAASTRTTGRISSSTRGCASSWGTSPGAATRSGCTRASARTATPRARARSSPGCCASPRPRACPGRVGRAPALPALGQPGHVAQLGGCGAELRQHARLRRGGRLSHRHVPRLPRVRPRASAAPCACASGRSRSWT